MMMAMMRDLPVLLGAADYGNEGPLGATDGATSRPMGVVLMTFDVTTVAIVGTSGAPARTRSPPAPHAPAAGTTRRAELEIEAEGQAIVFARLPPTRAARRNPAGGLLGCAPLPPGTGSPAAAPAAP